MSFLTDLEDLGGSLLGSVGESVKVYATTRAEVEAMKSAQPETARAVEPVKGVNEKGQTLVVEPTKQGAMGFTPTKMQLMYGGGALGLIVLGFVAFSFKK